MYQEEKEKDMVEEIKIEKKTILEMKLEETITEIGTEEKETKEKISTLTLKLNVPFGSISTIANVANYIKTKFNIYEMEVIIKAEKGEISPNRV